MPQGEQHRRYLIRRPQALQYFHHGELKRNSEGERVSGRFELFLDLLYVALVANFAEKLTEEPTGAGLVKYILIFAPAWHAWSEIKELSNSYYSDDILQRILTLWLMALLVLYGNNAPLVEDINALRSTVAVYIVARLTCATTYAIYSIPSHFHRHQNRVYAGLTFLGLFIWVPMFFESISIRAKIAVAVIAILYEEATFFFSFGPWIKKLLKLTYSTAVDIPHEVDRAAAFYTIVLGEFLYYIIVRSPAAIGLNLGAMRAIWTLVIAFCLNWLYDNADGSFATTHPLRRSVWSAFAWMMLHLPLAAGLLIGGHICAVSVAEEELGTGLRWLWGGGLAVGMAVLCALAFCFRSEDPPGTLLIPKPVRMAPRLVVAAILALLPLASPERLDMTDLLSIAAGLFAFVVIWETVTSLECGAEMIESWKGQAPQQTPTEASPPPPEDGNDDEKVTA